MERPQPIVSAQKVLEDGTTPAKVSFPVEGVMPSYSNKEIFLEQKTDPVFKKTHTKVIKPTPTTRSLLIGFEGHEEISELMLAPRNPLDYNQYNEHTLERLFNEAKVPQDLELADVDRRIKHSFSGINYKWMKVVFNMVKNPYPLSLYNRQAYVVKRILRFVYHGTMEPSCPIDIPSIDANFDALRRNYEGMKDPTRVIKVWSACEKIFKELNHFSSVQCDIETAKALLTNSKILEGDLVAGIDTSDITEEILPSSNATNTTSNSNTRISTATPRRLKDSDLDRMTEEELVKSKKKLQATTNKRPSTEMFDGYTPEFKTERKRQIEQAAAMGAELPSYRADGKSKRFKMLTNSISQPAMLMKTFDIPLENKK